VFSRSADLTRDAMERAAIALAPLRPTLDERAQLVASRIRVKDVLEGREPTKEMMQLPVMRDVQVGRAYEGRWERYAHKLAEMRGEDLAEVDDGEPGVAPERAPESAPATTEAMGSKLADLVDSFGVTTPPATPPAPAAAARPASIPEDPAAVDRAASLLLADLDAPKLTAREHIIMILGDVYPEAWTSGQIGDELERRTGAKGNRPHRQELLGDMVKRGQILRVDESSSGGRYTVKR
jgi:hypothetical protein